MRTALSTNQQHTFFRSLGKLLLGPRLQSILRIAVNFERKAVILQGQEWAPHVQGSLFSCIVWPLRRQVPRNC